MRSYVLLILFCIVFSCKEETKVQKETTEETSDLSAISTKDITEFKVLDSKYINKNKFGVL